MAGNNLAWGMPIFARVVWGQKKFTPGPFFTGKASVPIAWAAVVFLLFGIVLAMFPSLGPNPTPQDMNYTVVVNMAVWGGATIYYFASARKWFTGPKTTVEEAEVVVGHAPQKDQVQEVGKDELVRGESDKAEGSEKTI